MPMYTLVPADSEARKHPPIKPFSVPDQMVNHPHPKTSSLHSDNAVKKKNLRCDICGKTYKNKKSLADHKRRYHSKLPLRLFSNRKEEKFTSDRENGSDSDQSGDSMKYGDDISRKRNISPDTNASRKKRKISESEDGDSDGDKSSKHSKGSKPIHGSRALISHPRRKRSISPDTHRVLKKIKRRHAEESAKRKIRKNLEKRRRNKRKMLRRKVVTPKYIEPRNTDDEVGDIGSSKNTDDDVDEKKIDRNNDHSTEEKSNEDSSDDDVGEKKIDGNNENEHSTEENSDEDSSDDDDVDKSKYVNCVSVEDFEKVRKAIKNYRSDIVINDDTTLHVIQTLFKGILDGWIPICTSQKQMFSKDAIELVRKVRESKIIDLHSLISKNKTEFENIFNFIDKSIKLVVESYNKFGIIDDNGKPK